jgi:hypothetical protein
VVPTRIAHTEVTHITKHQHHALGQEDVAGFFQVQDFRNFDPIEPYAPKTVIVERGDAVMIIKYNKKCHNVVGHDIGIYGRELWHEAEKMEEPASFEMMDSCGRKIYAVHKEGKAHYLGNKTTLFGRLFSQN